MHDEGQNSQNWGFEIPNEQSTPIHSNILNFRPGKWQWYTTKLIIYKEESESGLPQIAKLGLLEIWPIYQVK